MSFRESKNTTKILFVGPCNIDHTVCDSDLNDRQRAAITEFIRSVPDLRNADKYDCVDEDQFSVVAQIFEDAPIVDTIGGTPSNQACTTAQLLGDKARVSICLSLPDDKHGGIARRHFADNGVAVNDVADKKAKLVMAESYVYLLPNGKRIILKSPKVRTKGSISPKDITDDILRVNKIVLQGALIDQINHGLFQSLIARLPAKTKLFMGYPTNPNTGKTHSAYFRQVAQMATAVCANDVEFKAVNGPDFDPAIRRIVRDWRSTHQGLLERERHIVITNGSKPVTHVTSADRIKIYEPLPVTVKDETGAGDAFFAAFIAATTVGMEEPVRLASTVGTLATMHRGSCMDDVCGALNEWTDAAAIAREFFAMRDNPKQKTTARNAALS